MISTAKGRRQLSDLGIHPIPFTTERPYFAATQTEGYMIDKKGNIIGTMLLANVSQPFSFWVNIPKMPATTKIKIEFAKDFDFNKPPSYDP